jgi:hypothetical protein
MNAEINTNTMNTEIQYELFQDGVCVTPHHIRKRNNAVKLSLKWQDDDGHQIIFNTGEDGTEEEYDALYMIFEDQIWMYAQDVLKYGTDDACKIMILDWIDERGFKWDENTKKIVSIEEDDEE